MNELLSMETKENALNYWMGKIDCDIPELNLPYDHPRSSDAGNPQKKNIKQCTFIIPKEINLKIRTIAEREDIDSEVIFTTVFKILLFRYSGEGNICLGTSNSIINSLLDEDMTFRNALHEIKKITQETKPYQIVSLNEIAAYHREIGNANQFIQAIINFNNESQIDKASKLTDEVLTNIELRIEGIKLNNEVLGTFHYDSGVFEKETILRMIGHFNNHQLINLVYLV